MPSSAGPEAERKPLVAVPGATTEPIGAPPTVGGFGANAMLGGLMKSLKKKALKSVNKLKTYKLRRWLLDTLTT